MQADVLSASGRSHGFAATFHTHLYEASCAAVVERKAAIYRTAKENEVDVVQCGRRSGDGPSAAILLSK